MYIFSKHQKEQVKVIDDIERQTTSGTLKFSTVEPADDFDNDQRFCLTSVHFPKQSLLHKIRKEIQEPLQCIAPEQYYYKPQSLHMTIKNIRVINDPPHFTNEDIETARHVFSRVIPTRHSFNVYFYRLLLLPMNLILAGTTDPELDLIHHDLDRELRTAGIPDNKQYTNSKYFFSNVTVARFTEPVTDKFRQKVQELSQTIQFNPYLVDSVTLIRCNASIAICDKIQTWKLV